jgi:ABC-type transport system involved in multi-copper enzyme maturation permease subunit
MNQTAGEITQLKQLKSEFDISTINVQKGKAWRQIGYTISFEATRNLKKIMGMAIVDTLMIILFVIINVLQDNPPTEAVDYITGFLGSISFIVLIDAILFGSSMIVEDFEKQTGNLLFPKIERGRLLIGRYIARFVFASIALAIYYVEIAILTYIDYDVIPQIMWESLGWAILYLHLVLAIVVLVSACLNRVATTTVVSMLVMLILFNMITSILMFTESTVEPLFVITYYSNIITAWFDMPDSRFREFSPNFGGGPGGQPVENVRTFTQWITPSASGAILGMIIYSSLMLLGAYLIYRGKQAKQ